MKRASVAALTSTLALALPLATPEARADATDAAATDATDATATDATDATATDATATDATATDATATDATATDATEATATGATDATASAEAAVPPAVPHAKTNPPRLLTTAMSPPRTPAPFILPDLAHDRWDIGVDWFLGRMQTTPGNARRGTTAALIRASMEANVFLPRRLYLGVAYPIGLGMPPDGGLAAGELATPAGAQAFGGNIEAHIRAVFPLPTWLEIGFLLGVAAPTAVFARDERADRSASAAVGALDPTSYVDFLPGRVVLRPAGDLRIRRGPFVFQGRHGLDFLIDNQGIDKATIAGRLLLHIGYVLLPSLEVSIEAQQMYFFTSDPKATTGTPAERAFAETYRIQDGHRSFITMGPALRASTTNFDYGVAFITNVADPLSPVIDRMLGLRLSLVGHIPR